MTGAEYMGLIASLPCACCGASPPSTVHHIRAGQGMGQRAPDTLTLPLCPACHQGPQGVHGDRSRLILRKKSELSMLAVVIETLMSQKTPSEPTKATEPATDAIYLGEAWLREAKHDWCRFSLHPEHLSEGNPFQGPGKPVHYMLAVIPIHE